jgi:pimeloyl-ACP methyl ester carboxylesterase
MLARTCPGAFARAAAPQGNTMHRSPRNHISDLRGTGRLAIDAIAGVTGLVEELHTTIADKPLRFADPLTRAAVTGTTGAVYRTVRGVTRVVGSGIDIALRALAPALGEMESPPRRDALVGTLNGVLGDYLAETGNPLAIGMQLRSAGRRLELTREALAHALPGAGGRVVVLVHGLCMNDRQWNRAGHDHGAALARDLGCTAVYLQYNSGLHISTNGRQFAGLLEALLAAWPVPVHTLTIVAHSMGGLVARSAHACATEAGHAWPARLRELVFLGTPHHGAPLERGGQWLELQYGNTAYIAPFARLGKIRSAGITDLRHGLLRDEDWDGHDRFAKRADPRQPLPLPEGVRCYAVAARLGAAAATRTAAVVGDGLVPVSSALGKHRDAHHRLAFAPEHLHVVEPASHFDLLSSPAVYERLLGWLG